MIFRMIDLDKIPIFCINLDKRPARYEKFCKQPGVKELLPKIQRFSAVDGTLLDLMKSDQVSLQTKYNIKHKTRRSHGEINTVGAIGCSLSHYQVWQKFLKDSKASHCLVLEDDVEIPVGLSSTIASASASASASAETKAEADIWALSYRLYDKTLVALETNWKSPVYYWGTAAYIISRQGAEKLSAAFFPIGSHMDKYFCLMNSLGYIRLVVHDSINLHTLSSGTDIQMYPCDLCDLPDDYKGIAKHSQIAKDNYLVYASVAAAAGILALFLISTHKNV